MFADRQGSVIWVTDPATGSVVAAYEYDGYGQITQTVGTLAQPYGYTGREYDPESGLYHYRARAYDPGAGVFVQEDPIGFSAGGTNLFPYAFSDPFNFNDPSGRTTVGASQQAKGEDRLRKSVLPNINYGIGSVLGLIGEMLGWEFPYDQSFKKLPADVRNFHPNAGSGASSQGENDPKCIAAKARVRSAKAKVQALGASCTLAKDPLNVARMRANLEEGLARTQRDIVCPMDPVDLMTKGATPVGELHAKMNAFGHFNRCRAIISLWGK